MILDIAIAIGDKVLPEVIKKFIPLLKIQPKKLLFTTSEWKSNFFFFIYNKHKQVLFDVYLLIDIGNAKSNDFELSKTDSPKDLVIPIGNIIVNYEIIRLNCIYEDDKEFILLKIAQMDPESYMPFQIETNKNSEVRFKILKYSKEQKGVLSKPQAGAVLFEIPLKTEKEIRLKEVSVLMKKEI